MNRVALQVLTFLLADLAFDWVVGVFLVRFLVALSTVELELVLGGHDYVLANRAKVFRRLQQPMNLHDVSVVAAELVEILVASINLALNFLDLAIVCFESFLPSEFLKHSIIIIND